MEEKTLIDLKENNFFVDGVCKMCKDRIENALDGIKGVKWAEWNISTKILQIKGNNELNYDEIGIALSKVGHDNWMLKADEQAYQNLEDGCKYRMKKINQFDSNCFKKNAKHPNENHLNFFHRH